MQVASPEVDAGNPGFLESKSLFDGDGKNCNWTPCTIGYHRRGGLELEVSCSGKTCSLSQL